MKKAQKYTKNLNKWNENCIKFTQKIYNKKIHEENIEKY